MKNEKRKITNISMKTMARGLAGASTAPRLVIKRKIVTKPQVHLYRTVEFVNRSNSVQHVPDS